MIPDNINCRQKPDKWTEAEWRAHQQWLGNRARHKWPFDFQLPEPFSDPITKLPPKKVLLPRPIILWVKQYEKQLQLESTFYPGNLWDGSKLQLN